MALNINMSFPLKLPTPPPKKTSFLILLFSKRIFWISCLGSSWSAAPPWAGRHTTSSGHASGWSWSRYSIIFFPLKIGKSHAFKLKIPGLQPDWELLHRDSHGELRCDLCFFIKNAYWSFTPFPSALLIVISVQKVNYYSILVLSRPEHWHRGPAHDRGGGGPGWLGGGTVQGGRQAQAQGGGEGDIANLWIAKYRLLEIKVENVSYYHSFLLLLIYQLFQKFIKF